MKILDKRFVNLTRKVRYIRRRRYEIYKDIPSESILELTKEEFELLDMLAKKIENKSGHDCFEELVNIYSKMVKRYINEEPSIGLQRFQVVLGVIEHKHVKHKLKTVGFFAVQELEELMGDMAIYDGEKVLMHDVNRLTVKQKLMEYLGEKGYYYFNAMENDGKTLADLGVEDGLTREGVRLRCVSAVKGNNCKGDRLKKRLELQEMAEFLQNYENIDLI